MEALSNRTAQSKGRTYIAGIVAVVVSLISLGVFVLWYQLRRRKGTLKSSNPGSGHELQKTGQTDTGREPRIEDHRGYYGGVQTGFQTGGMTGSNV